MSKFRNAPPTVKISVYFLSILYLGLMSYSLSFGDSVAGMAGMFMAALLIFWLLSFPIRRIVVYFDN